MNVFYYLTVDTILISRTRIILYTNEALTYARVGGDFTSFTFLDLLLRFSIRIIKQIGCSLRSLSKQPFQKNCCTQRTIVNMQINPISNCHRSTRVHWDPVEPQ